MLWANPCGPYQLKIKVLVHVISASPSFFKFTSNGLLVRPRELNYKVRALNDFTRTTDLAHLVDFVRITELAHLLTSRVGKAK